MQETPSPNKKKPGRPFSKKPQTSPKPPPETQDSNAGDNTTPKKETSQPKKSGITRIDSLSNGEMIFGNTDEEKDKKYMIPKNTKHKFWVHQWKTWPEGSDMPGVKLQGSDKKMSYDQAYWLRYMHIPENPKKGVEWKPGFLKQIGLSFRMLNDPRIIRLRTADGDFELMHMEEKECIGKDADGRVKIPMNDIIEFINLT